LCTLLGGKKKLSSSDACTSKPYPVLAHLQFLLTPPSSRLTSVRMESSVSTTDSGGSNPLPLIVCDKCGKWWVVRRLSKQPWSYGQPLYCCPAHKVSVGFGQCSLFATVLPFDEYIELLQGNKKRARGPFGTSDSKMKDEGCSGKKRDEG